MGTQLNQRSSNFELLRIIAMLMIVTHHYAIHGIRYWPDWRDGIEINKLFTSFLYNGGEIGNGIFFLLTGYFT